jgi:hypothetical protein
LRLYAGRFDFDLQGIGLDNHIAAAYANQLNQILSFKISGTYIRTHQQYQQTIPLIIPEVGIDISKDVSITRLFIGIGTGVGIDTRDNIPSSITYAKLVNSGSGVEAVLEKIEMDNSNRFTPTTYLELGIQIRPKKNISFFMGEIQFRGHEYYPTGSSTEISLGIGTPF